MKNTKTEKIEIFQDISNNTQMLSEMIYTSGMKRAFSCLIEPKDGDIVLVAKLKDKKDQGIVLAILSRPGMGDATLSLSDPLASLSIKAQQFNVDAKTEVNFSAPEMKFVSKSMSIISNIINTFSKFFNLRGDKFRNVIKEQFNVGQTIMQQSVNRVSITEGVDKENSKIKIVTSEISVDKIHSGLIQAKGDLRFNANRIMMG